MEEKYNPRAIEPAAQARWERDGAFAVAEDPTREKFYCLSMLPYPSGKLHMGHVRNYSIGDAISRFQRLKGKNVLQPMGWDAFGLPAENAAVKHGVAPAKWTYENIDHMRAQLKRLGFAYDWSREFATCRPEYYEHEQRMFVRLFEKGLVYRKSAVVNWDPIDQTVLANEQVVDGRGWRSGAVVEKREIPQWFIRITDYADELLDELEGMDWPEAVKTMQRNWIGRSEGAEFEMDVCDDQGAPLPGSHKMRVYTTRPDTSFGMTYAVLAPEHPLVDAVTTPGQKAAVEAFVASVQDATETDRTAEGGSLDKRGVATGAYVMNPFTGKPVPIFIADYVLMGYGTGAIMAVPGQDARDWDFAKAHGLPIVRTVEPPEGFEDGPFLGDGPAINSDWLDGLDVPTAKEKAIAWIEERGIGERQVHYRLRDWGVSRQRYWGCPIPMVFCEACGTVPVPEGQLPVVLPEDVEFMGVKSPIKADPDWRKVTCPKCGGAAERETDTFDTFVESSWYYARYTSPGADDMVDERANYWLPVDQYIGGIEHAVLHLLYFRFWHKLMRDLGMVESNEPATRLLCQGMVVAETFFREVDGQTTWFNPAEVDIERDTKGQMVGAVSTDDGEPVAIGRLEKMSKSKNNGVDPQGLIDAYGADTVRVFSLFASPPDQSLEWSDSGVEGAFRFLKRLWRNVFAHISAGAPAALDKGNLSDPQRRLRRLVHQTIEKVGDDFERRYTFNTAIAAIMELGNALAKAGDDSPQGLAVAREGWQAIVVMLSPIAPHACETLWAAFGSGDLDDELWPEVDAEALEAQRAMIVVQVNGKLRGRVTVSAEAAEEEVLAAARADENVARFVDDKTVRKVIYVPGRLLNLVVS